MTPEQEQEEFGHWLDAQSPERVQIAFARAVKEFEEDFFSMETVEEFMADEDFMVMFAHALNQQWARDVVTKMQAEGLAVAEVLPDGELSVVITEKGLAVADQLQEQYA